MIASSINVIHKKVGWGVAHIHIYNKTFCISQDILLSVPHPDVFWAYHFLEGLDSFVIPQNPQWLQLRVQKYVQRTGEG